MTNNQRLRKHYYRAGDAPARAEISAMLLVSRRTVDAWLADPRSASYRNMPDRMWKLFTEVFK